MSFTLYTKQFDDEDYPTGTSLAELSNEEAIRDILLSDFKLLVEPHIKYVKNLYERKSASGMAAETFSIWSATYTLFILRVLNYTGDDFHDIIQKTTSYLERRKCINGGYSGLTYDNTHLVTNYSLIMSIGLIGTEEAFSMVDRDLIYKALLQLKCPNGSFRTTRDMENDIRATFVALLIADTLNILTDELTANVPEYVLSCNSYDGGFGPVPGVESHGGYVHCAVGAMYLLHQLDRLNLNSLMRWIAMRQMEYSGGFQGRTNKLVDSCYSWWIGSACRIISDHLKIPPFWNEPCLSEYTLRSSQSADGGFRDHAPSKVDPFHTFYGLAGMCVCGETKIPGVGADILPEIDTLICVPKELAEKMRAYYRARPFVPK
ncbi:Protein farnesyltransferase subunit beta [Tritrichomonas foetus]|uniref:Protein farnesyltransferase subunit beta n=1 Tax=Tritrichomonas foetus TaxID=1144522 RepID=A0A1J4K5W1_9EUKA|nr:Protein farnesyltransferase subunit beta [Tritrichomonas foetus]|eukprot:OHT06841.1 Protein farnesyltransferase subunit beta [Tritrichomonas foetus]